MTALAHPIAPENVMALMDGELTAAEAALVTQHIEQCAECALLRDQLHNTSKFLSDWAVPPVPATLDRIPETRLAGTGRNHKLPRMNAWVTRPTWRIWAVAAGSAVFGALALLVFETSIPHYDAHTALEPSAMMAVTRQEPYSRQIARSRDVTPFSGGAQAVGSNAIQASAPEAGPLISRSASLTVVVKNLDAARGGLDAILARHHGYSANLTILEETSPRGLTGSLRIPAAELDTAIAEIRALGIVQRESLSGEEVTQRHTDLTARLANARETETRLRDILANRTGKMQDVLDVEDRISETRGEIEQLEAEQKNLEHRVAFASVDLELVEQYEARLGNPSTSIPNQVRNSLVAGLRHAGGSLLGLVLFLEEYGPVLLMWLVLLGVPGILLWRRYFRIKSALR